MKRIRKLQDLMEELNFSSFILTTTPNIFYFTNFMGSGYLVIPLNGNPQLYVYPIDYEAAQTYCIQEVEINKLKITSNVAEIVIGMPGSLKKKVGFDRLEVEQYFKVREHVEVIESPSDLVWKLRTVKDVEELEKISKAAEISSKCMDLASQIISEGVRESEVKAEIVEEMIRSGADKPAFDIIVASSSRSTFPHGGVGDRQFVDGDIVVVDLGASYEGYCADMTRTYHIGSNPSEEELKIYNLVLETKNLVEENTKSWILAASLDEAARRIISAKGYGEFFVHGLGHGIGIEVHEPPKINQVSQEIIQENNVITIEPGIYIPKKFGIRIEDTLVVGRDGVSKLTSSPYDFALY
ncbi:MAG: Xaa-Pro peptidase family protein [Aigarchaeota archaeon]|nr:Xaa-Pro peptidase family protein [Aigarchaeota archaeon]MCX8193390.1 Xaa-Pro peptidase family protein [Nitrososphaeria archaeon]MDW7985920.1 Xaa-Pro peptidase family protein [Nitrososphaerota archaeon]